MDKCGCEFEIWDCQGGPVEVMTDSDGCPLDQNYCKVQLGGAAVTIAAGAAGTITITTNIFSQAKVRGLVLQAIDPVGDVDTLHGFGVTSVEIQGIENISGEVPATRYRQDATGNNVGTGQAFRGNMGSAGGDAVIGLFNRSSVSSIVWAVLDVNAVR